MPFGAATQWHTEEQNIAIINWHLDNGMPIEDLDGYLLATGSDRRRSIRTPSRLMSSMKNCFYGIQAVSDAAHKRGVKYLLWFGGDERCRFQRISLP